MKINLCKLKDKIDPISKKDAVYKMNCKDCNAVYIGETSKTVGDRLEEHIRNNINKNHLSLIYQHSFEFGHQFDTENIFIL